MPIDYHVHLEEGPYTFSWLMKTILGIDEFSDNNIEIGSKERILKQIEGLNTRVKQIGLKSLNVHEVVTFKAKRSI